MIRLYMSRSGNFVISYNDNTARISHDLKDILYKKTHRTYDLTGLSDTIKKNGLFSLRLIKNQI